MHGSTECLCCGDPISDFQAKRGEHVLPKWVLRLLNLRAEEMLHVLVSAEDSRIERTKKQWLSGFTQRRVCQECNNGWMSTMENEARPILIPLIKGGRTLFDLRQGERLTVSRWAVKTAYVLSNTIMLDRPIRQPLLTQLWRSPSEVPRGIGVFGNQHNPSERASYFQKNFWITAARTEPPNSQPSALPPDEHSFKVSVQLGRLLLLVANPAGPVQYLLAGGLHIPVWPPEKIFRCYMPRQFDMPSLSPRVLEVFSDTLATFDDSGHLVIPRGPQSRP